MRPTYGNPPVFVPRLFVKVLAVAMTAALVGLVGCWFVIGPITRVDVVGTLVCTPIIAYLIHLWMAPMEAEQT